MSLNWSKNDKLNHSAVPDSELPDEYKDIIKCGEAFIYSNGKFGFTCFFCDQIIEGFDNFSLHLQELHLSNYSQEYPDDSKRQDETNLCIKTESEVIFLDDDSLKSDPLEPLVALDETSTTAISDWNEISSPTACDRNGKELKFQCGICEIRFTTQSGLARHRRAHSHLNIQGNGPTNSLNKSGARKKLPHLKCLYCDRLFYDNTSKTEHERTHTGEMPFECLICMKRFHRRNNLKKHLVTHERSRPFKCTKCPSKFKMQYNLSLHVRRSHLHDKPYVCIQCGKGYSVNADLKAHMKVHFGDSVASTYSEKDSNVASLDTIKGHVTL